MCMQGLISRYVHIIIIIDRQLLVARWLALDNLIPTILIDLYYDQIRHPSVHNINY